MKLGNNSIYFGFISFLSFLLNSLWKETWKYFTPRQVETELFLFAFSFSCEMNMSSIATEETKGQGKPHPLAFFMDVAHHSHVSVLSFFYRKRRAYMRKSAKSGTKKVSGFL